MTDRRGARRPGVRLHLAVLGVALAAAMIGPVTLPIGALRIVLQPLLFAFLLALLLNPAASALGRQLFRHAQPGTIAARYLMPAFYPFMAKLALLIGAEAGVVVQSGPALLLQEFGHIGTILLGLPVAVYLLRLRREAVGATFSIGREGSLAIVADRYGMEGAEGRGVLGVYVTGVMAGTIFFSLLTPLVVASGWFDPRALAMACGIGSASMTASCIGALTGSVHGDTDALNALAAASNIASTATGLYFSLFIALPLTEALYRRLPGTTQDRDVRVRPAAAADPIACATRSPRRCWPRP